MYLKGLFKFSKLLKHDFCAGPSGDTCFMGEGIKDRGITYESSDRLVMFGKFLIAAFLEQIEIIKKII